jgi:hypothetical protein
VPRAAFSDIAPGRATVQAPNLRARLFPEAYKSNGRYERESQAFAGFGAVKEEGRRRRLSLLEGLRTRAGKEGVLEGELPEEVKRVRRVAGHTRS